MLRQSSLLAVAVFLLSPTWLIAGGPPWLCLPIDGVTTENAKACAELLTTKLESKLSPHPGWDRGIEMHKHSNQWYLTFYMGEDVALRDVEAALKGSRFSVPQDRLRLFGHVILEIGAGKTTPKSLLAQLETLPYVSIAKSEEKANLLLVTVDMPYPVEDGGRNRIAVAWEKFQRNDFASNQSTKSEPPTTSHKLPSYDAVRDILAKHEASLKDIRWSTDYACRPLGGVAVRSFESSEQVRQVEVSYD